MHLMEDLQAVLDRQVLLEPMLEGCCLPWYSAETPIIQDSKTTKFPTPCCNINVYFHKARIIVNRIQGTNSFHETGDSDFQDKSAAQYNNKKRNHLP